jgi:putative peptidoglycan lipid II flippase
VAFPVNEEEQVRNRAIVRNSALISLFNGLGVLGGLALDMAVAAIFGLGLVTDAFFLAFTVPQFLMQVMQASYVSALVPVLTSLREGAGERIWTVFSSLMNRNAALMAAIAALGWFGAGWITTLIGAGLEPGYRTDAVALTRLLFVVLLPLGLAEVMRAQMNALERFALPAAARVFRHIGTLATLLLAYRAWGIRALAVGYVAGSILEALLLAVGIALVGGRYHLSWGIRDPDVREAMRLLVTRGAGMGLRRTGLIVERLLASFLPPGSVTALNYARRVSLALYDVFANSVNAAILPGLSESALSGNQAGLRQSLRLGYRLLGFVSFPASGLVAGLATTIVWVLFQRGAFDASATALTAGLLTIYVLQVPALSLVQVLLAPHYARRDAGTPTRHMAWMLLANAILAWVLMRWIGVFGLAWAGTLVAFLSLVRSYWLLRHLGELELGFYTVRILLASAAAGLLAWGGFVLASRMGWLTSTGSALATALASGLSGVLLFLAAGRLLGLDELGRLLRLFGLGLGRAHTAQGKL